MLNMFKRFSTGMLPLLLIACNPADDITLTVLRNKEKKTINIDPVVKAPKPDYKPNKKISTAI